MQRCDATPHGARGKKGRMPFGDASPLHLHFIFPPPYRNTFSAGEAATARLRLRVPRDLLTAHLYLFLLSLISPYFSPKSRLQNAPLNAIELLPTLKPLVFAQTKFRLRRTTRSRRVPITVFIFRLRSLCYKQCPLFAKTAERVNISV